jgi:hypothetical protein
MPRARGRHRSTVNGRSVISLPAGVTHHATQFAKMIEQAVAAAAGYLAIGLLRPSRRAEEAKVPPPPDSAQIPHDLQERREMSGSEAA